ncbi:30S ribosomal protein S1 [Algimonas ampicilliniresistens]|jgi:small subunit ribosomal protein S1|uniref:30S ribosomal protein S1 n=1 Tax=Algimonas ampicilliniresistens TaxID=1298735 RepID=A0ABQ5VD12_9PROT|nr:30S ribosomal protein S1 [Algimonas ampicilliniresistens]GLQ24970.1 30S ribosomal protein S1 [Algimonas ampicilliniresistens]
MSIIEETLTPTTDDFAAMFEAAVEASPMREGKVVEGIVTAIEKDVAIVDVGLKTEGRVELREFYEPGSDNKLKVGDTVEVFLERIENALGQAVLSRDKARREESWVKMAKFYEGEEQVKGVIVGRVKGGFTVDLGGINAFLPGSQVDIRPVRDIGPLMNSEQPFMILKMDRSRGNIVVSRRAILEESRAEQRAELVAQLQEGEVREGVVKNITDYGAFVDLGGIDGLLHVTDMSWRRVSHPSQVLNVGDTVQVKVIRINPETQRISLGMKQLQDDPWNAAAAKYIPGTRHTGRVTNIADYGAFIELEEGVEGLVHVSEMSWTKKNVHPGKIVSTSQEVEVEVLDVDEEKRRISLGLKQVQANPWDSFTDRFPIGSTISGEVKSVTEFGLFIGLEDDIDGMAHLSDLSWDKSGEEALKDYQKGQMVEAKILEVDVEKERISLGIKQLQKDTMPAGAKSFGKGNIVTCTVTNVQPAGLDVTFGEDDTEVAAFIRKGDLSRDRTEQRPERFAVGDKVDAMITRVDRKTRQYQMSIKALEISQEKEAVAQYGSSDSGASLGDILGAALKDQN